MQDAQLHRIPHRCSVSSLHGPPSSAPWAASPPFAPVLSAFPALPALDYLPRTHAVGFSSSSYPYSYLRSTSSPLLRDDDDDDSPGALPRLLASACAPTTPKTPSTPHDLFVASSPLPHSPPATAAYPPLQISPPSRPQHSSGSERSTEDASDDSDESNGSALGRRLQQPIEIHDDESESEDMDQVMHDASQPHPVVALLPPAAPAGALPGDPPGPMLVSLVPIGFGGAADLMGTGSSQIVNTADGFVCTECQRTFPRLNDANRHYSTKHDKPIPCPNPICRDTFPRRSDYLARHLFCNNACMAKALEIDASPEVPVEWRHRRGTPKSGSIIKSALEKVVKLRVQSSGLRATAMKRA